MLALPGAEMRKRSFWRSPTATYAAAHLGPVATFNFTRGRDYPVLRNERGPRSAGELGRCQVGPVEFTIIR